MNPTDLTPAERRMWKAFPRGEVVDFRQSSDEDPAHDSSWGPERTVRAEVVRALLLNGASDDGEIAALRLTGARISGMLNLQYATVSCADPPVGVPLRASARAVRREAPPAQPE